MFYFVSSPLIILSAFMLIIWIIQYYWRNRKFYILAKKLNGPLAWPLIGNALLLAGKSEDVTLKIIKLIELWKTPSRFWLGPRLIVVVHRPEDLEVVLQNSLNRANVYNLLKPLLGEGLFTTCVHRWKYQRKMMVSAFNQRLPDALVNIFQEKCNILVKQLEKKVDHKTFDIFPLISAFTLDIICKTAMDVNVNAQNGNCKYIHYAERAFEIIFQRMTKLWLHSDFIFNLTALAKEHDICIDYIHNFSKSVIEKKRRDLKSKILEQTNESNEFSAIKRKPFLDLLIEDTNCTDQEISEEVDILTFAANDTTATTLSFCLLMLAIHPEVQNKVYDEIQEIFGGSERPIKVSDFPKLKYMDLIIKETMRLFPVGPIMCREATSDFQMGPHFIPQGTTLLISVLSNHRNPEIWPNSNIFIPERFLPENHAKRHPYSYLPFAAGPRNCIGIKYAYMSMKSALTNILRAYKLETQLKMEDIKLKFEFTMKISPGFMITVSRRI